MADDIVQTIKVEVEGGDEAASALEKVGESASKSFEDTEKAAKTAGVSIEDFGRLSEKTQQAYIQLSQRVQAESHGIVQATQEVQQAASQAGSGTKDLGGGLDEVSQKSGVSTREMRALGKVMKEMGAGELAQQAVGFFKIASALGPLGVAAFALAEAFSFLKRTMTEMGEVTKAVEGLAKAGAGTVESLTAMQKVMAETGETGKKFGKDVASSLAEIAKINAELAAGTGDKAFFNDLNVVVNTLNDIRNGAREVINALTDAGTVAKALAVIFKDMTFEQQVMWAAKFREKLDAIGKLKFDEALKKLHFSDEQIASIAKGSKELQKLAEQAKKPFFTPEQQKSIDNLSNAWDLMVAASKRAWAMVAGDADTGAKGWAQSLGAAIATGFADMMAILGQLLHGEMPKAWSDMFDSIGQIVSTKLGEIKASIVAFVTEAPGNAWQWIVDTFNSAVAGVSSAASSAYSAIVTFVTESAGGAWQWIVDTFNSAVESLKGAASAAAGSIVAFVTTPFAGAWQWIVDAWNAMLAKLGIGAGGAAAPATADVPGRAGGGLLGGRGTGTSDSNLAWVSRGEYIVPARVVQQPGVLAFLEALRRSGRLTGHAAGGLIPAYASGGEVSSGVPVEAVKRMIDRALGMIDRIIDTIIQANDGIIGGLIKIGDDIFKFADSTANKIKQEMDKFAGSIKTAMDGFSAVTKFMAEFSQSIGKNASGGLLGGRGTGTSDSNLAWVSRGEYITPARAVAQPGVLAFLEALRRSGGNIRDVLDGMGRFALGGMVRAPLAIPAFAGGGMHAVTIQFPGLPEITGLRASSGVVDELRQAAAMAQVRSGGRKPSRYS